LSVPCDRCGAEMGERCAGLVRATDFHTVRVARAQTVARETFTGPTDPAKEAVRQLIARIRAEHGWT
jgi:putative heme iron utilization protein